jgi:CRP/FNR family cyclic AMP-dependent transcriptional regulator
MPDELLRKFTKIYAPGSVIFREGEDGEEMYIVQKGRVRVSKAFSGKTLAIAVIEKGDFFGETAIVNRVTRTATVTAIDDVELLAFDREGLVNMITKNPRIAMSIIDKLCRRLREAQQTFSHLVARDEMGLISLYLYHVFEEESGGKPVISYQKIVDELSLRLELPRENVIRVLEKVAAEGITSRKGDEIELKDREKLLDFTG